MSMLLKLWALKKYFIIFFQFLLPFFKKRKNENIPEYGLTETIDVIRFIIEIAILFKNDPDIFKAQEAIAAAFAAINDISKVPNELAHLSDSDREQIKQQMKNEYPNLKIDWLDTIDISLKVARILAGIVERIK